MLPAARAADEPAPAAADLTTLKLLDALEERRMPDVVIWVLDRIAADKDAGPTLKQEAAYRRAKALLGVTRTEADPGKRAAVLDQAEQAFDAFLASNPPLDRRVDALMEKGSLLVARGRLSLDQAKRPGADAAALQAAARPFFEKALKTLEGKTRGKDDPITSVDTAEDAALKAHREIDAALKAATGGRADEGAGEGEAKAGKAKPNRRSVGRMEEEREAIRGQLLQVRLLVADTYFDLAGTYPPQSADWKKSIDASTQRYAELFKKYPNRGAGLLAHCNEGRNLAALGEHQKALSLLADMRALEGSGEFIDSLKSKALNTSLECWLATQQDDGLTDDMLRVAKATVADDALDADVLGMKYRAALVLERRAAAIPEDKKAQRKPLRKDAHAMALVVAKASRDFAIEARDLLARLGTDFEDTAGVEATFDSLMDEANLALTTMQEKQAVAKKAAGEDKTEEAKEATAAAGKARGQAIQMLERALGVSKAAELEAVNQARYLLTYLLYDAGRLHEAATLGGFLADRYPSSRGSDQAAMIAMASWQQLQKQADPAWAADARDKCGLAAESILRGWPDGKTAGDAAIVAIAAAVEARDPRRIMAVLALIPPTSPRRSEVLLRAGMGLNQLAQQARRREGPDRPAEADLVALRKQAAATLDQGLAAIPQNAPADAVSVAAALARCQLAMEDGDDARVKNILEHPGYGPWTAVKGTLPAGVPESVAGSTLTLALRHFIGTRQIEKAEQAMDLLEKQAGTGAESAAKLTAMYLSMGRDLEEQLRGLAGSGADATPERAAALLAGFEAFLDRVAERDEKVSSQMWVGSTYHALAAGEAAGGAVPQAQREKYLDKAAKVYEKLLAGGGAELGRFEPTLRLKIASIYQERSQWDEARKHVDWFLTDATRQNMIDVQIEAAKLAQAAGQASGDAAQAARLFREAVSGDKAGGRVAWGWGGIANKLVRQAFSGGDERAQRAQAQFFDARLNLARCRLAWADKDAANRDKLLELATNDIAITYKLYPSLGGEAMRQKFDALLREIQTARGQQAAGLAAIEATPAGAGS
jgi:hypothetical protein